MRSLFTCRYSQDVNSGAPVPPLGNRFAGKDWDTISRDEWDVARSLSPFVEATGDIHLHLLKKFGGADEHVPYPRRARLLKQVERFTAVHHVYRWFPPLGSRMFDGRRLANEFLGFIIKNGPGWVEGASLLIAVSCDLPGWSARPGLGAEQFIGLVLQSGRRALLFVGLPSDGDGRHERIPWLVTVVQSPFDLAMKYEIEKAVAEARGFQSPPCSDAKRSNEIAEAAWQHAWSAITTPGTVVSQSRVT